MAESASEIAGSLVPLSKQQAMLMLESVYLCMDLGRWDQARELALGTCQLMPKSEVPQLALGTLEFNQQKYDKALQAFRAAQRIAPKTALPRAHCGEALQAMGKYNEAIRELNTAIDLEPESPAAGFAVDIMLVIAERQHEAGKLDDAHKTLQTALEHQPNNAFALAHLGKTQMAAGKNAEAIATLNRAIELDPEGQAASLARIILAVNEPIKPPRPSKGKK